MPTHDQATVTRLLGELQSGNRDALGELFHIVYDELHALAHRQRARWHGDFTMNTTALIHEAYLKLVDQDHIDVSSRPHFLALAAKAMRHILCNYARDRARKKRGGSFQRVSIDDLSALPATFNLSTDNAAILIELDTALEELHQHDDRLAEVVNCRFFGSMSIEETAAALGTSPATVKRQWQFARTWLYRRLHDGATQQSDGTR